MAAAPNDPYLTPQELAVTEEASTRARADFEDDPKGKRAKSIRLWLFIAGHVFAAGAVLTPLLASFLVQLTWRPAAAICLSLLFVSGVLYAIGIQVYRSALESFRPLARHEALRAYQQKQQEVFEQAKLPALLAFNREEMSRYHKITTTQASRASRQSQIAISIGFLVLVAGAITAIRVQDPTSKVVIASLTSLGGLFSAYITRTFFVAEKSAVDQLYRYWQQPLSASYLLFAERLAKDLAELNNPDAGKELTRVIDQVLHIAVPQLAAETDAAATRNQRKPRSGTPAARGSGTGNGRVGHSATSTTTSTA